MKSCMVYIETREQDSLPQMHIEIWNKYHMKGKCSLMEKYSIKT